MGARGTRHNGWRGPEICWQGKDQVLVPSGVDGYEWVSPDDPRVSGEAVLDVRSQTRPRRTSAGAASGLLVCADAFDALRNKTVRAACDANGGVRLIYIDPPYNSRQGYGQYSDSLDHAVWLSMLRDRLLLAKTMLSPTGSVWVHLDDSETHRARLLLDEVFGEEAFVATIVWQKRTTRDSRAAFSINHEYIHVYAPLGPKGWKRTRNTIAKIGAEFRNRDDDPRGPWTDAPFTAPGFRRNQHYVIVNPAGDELRPPRGRSWYATEAVYQQLVADNRIWFPRKGSGLPRIKLFPTDVRGLVPFTLWGPDHTGTNDDATRHLLSLFPDREAFATPKPESLLHKIIHIGSDPGDLVLDFFAGSGTTAAVAHKMGRHWIAVERSSAVVETYAEPRLSRVVAGADPGGITELVHWEGGGSFRSLMARASASIEQAS